MQNEKIALYRQLFKNKKRATLMRKQAIMRTMASQLAQYIGERLRTVRIQKGMTQEEIAKRAGTERGYYAKLEQGYTLPSLKLLEKILKALDAQFRDVLP